ncbi:CaiB/BaiF CoA transferase family protein [Thermodesulfobacteriota bacterium]
MKPLEGIRIIDLTHALSGPICTHQLSLLGAEVIKFEPPEQGDEFRNMPSDIFVACNAGKKSVTLNLKAKKGQETLYRFLKDGDVLIENFRPGVSDKLGLTWEKLSKINPRLIYCSISGFGQDGVLRDRPALEWTVQAISGMTASYVDEDEDARKTGLGVIDTFTGYVAFSSILSALLQRQQTDKGQRIDVAMLDSAFVLQTPQMVSNILRDEAGNEQKIRANVGHFHAKDGRVFICTLLQKWFESLCEVLEAPELLSDPRFTDIQKREENSDAYVAEVESRLAKRPAAEWEKELVRRKVPTSVVGTMKEIANHPHVKNRGILSKVKADGHEDPITLVGAAFKFNEGGPSFQGPVPSLGEHTKEVLNAAGFTDDEINEMKASGVI